MITTIRIDPAARERLAALKRSSQEAYDEFLNRLLSLIPLGDEEGPYADAFRMGLLHALLEIRPEHLTDHARVKKRLGL